MKFLSRLVRIAAKVGQLGFKLLLIRCFGIEGAAFILADLAAAHERLRVARPAVSRTIGKAMRRARSSMVAMTRRLIHKLSYKINSVRSERQTNSVVGSRRS